MITHFFNAGGGNVTVTSANALTTGEIITISGTTSYNGSFTVSNVTPTSFNIVATFIADDATGSWQLAGGMISGCTTTGATGAITLNTVPSRYNGVAPLSVFFDTTATTASTTTRPFHDLEYRWNFGDPLGTLIGGVTTWGTGARAGISSRNMATGPVAAHVFERPGTYTVALSATDGTNTVSNICAQIVVQDPDLVFAGTNTICVGATSTPAAGSGGAGECPIGANRVQQSSFPAAISSYASTGKRVLFRRGDTFNAATEAIITATGPGIVGAFGPNSTALPLIQMSGNTNTLGFSSSSTPDFKDWRIMDLDMDGMGGNATSGTGISSASGGLAQITVLRLTYRNMNNAIGFALDLINYYNNYFISLGRTAEAIHSVDQVTVVDSTVIPGSNTVYSAYDSGNRIVFMGNNFDNGGGGISPGGSHITRWPFLNKAVISNNTFSHPGGTRLTIKLHAPYWNAADANGIFDPTATHPNNSSNSWSNYSTFANGDGYTKYIVITDNKLTDAANPWSVELGPQDQWNDERIKNVVVERNWWVANTSSQVALRISASEITVKNNIYDFSNGSSSQTGIQIVKDGIVITSDQVRLYNNTFYTSYAVPSSQFAAIDVGAPVTNITVKNNLAYAPNASGPVMLVNNCGACLTQSNNSTDSQVKNASPLFLTTPPILNTDWKVTSTSYAIGSGAAVPIWSDFFLTPQPATRDLGAVIH